MFGGNPGRVVLSQLINELPRTHFHKHPYDINTIAKIANVRDPLKFKH